MLKKLMCVLCISAVAIAVFVVASAFGSAELSPKSAPQAAADASGTDAPEAEPSVQAAVKPAAAVPAEQPAAPSASLDLQKIERIINLNRVYGPFVDNDDAVIEEACIVLLDQAEPYEAGLIIRESIVREFIRNVYGREVREDAGRYADFPAPEGYYMILPRGYSLMSHRVTGARLLSDGTVEVHSELFLQTHDAPAEQLTSTAILKPDAQSAYGYIIVSAVIDQDVAQGETLAM